MFNSFSPDRQSEPDLQDALYQSHQFLHWLMNITSKAVFWKDHNSVYLGCNRNFAISCGLGNPDEIVGLTDYDLPWPKEQADFYRKIDQMVIQSGQPRYHIIQLQTLANGRDVWIETSKTPLYDQKGQIIGVLGIEKNVHQRGERYVLSEAQINVGSWVWDEQSQLFQIDQTAKSILGLMGTGNTLTMTEFMRMVHPDDSFQVRQGVEALLNQRSTLYEKKYRIIQSNGAVRGVLVRGTAVYNSQIQSYQIGGTISDLSATMFGENTNDHRPDILEAITYSSQNLLSTSELDKIIPDVLGILGRAIGYNRVYLLKNNMLMPDNIVAKQTACWSAYADHTTKPKLRPAIFNYQAIGLEGWCKELQSGKVIYGLIDEFPAKEQHYLANQAVTSFIWLPVFCEGDWWGVLGFDDRAQQAPHFAEIEVLRNAAGAIGAAISQQQSQQAERDQRALAEALRDTARVLNSTLNLDEVLDRIFSEISNVVPHDSANIILVENRRARVVRSRRNPKSPFIIPTLSHEFAISTFPILQRMIATRDSIITTDPEQMPFSGTEWGMEWVRSYAGTPIQHKNKVIGFINLFGEKEGFFQQIHAERLHAFADQAAIAISNARLYEQAQELAALEERQRLARDLHDSVNQTLWTASMLSDVIPALWEQDPENGRNSLEKLRRLNQAALAEMRALLLELRPAAIITSNLGDLIEQLSAAVMSRKNIHIQLQLEGEAQLEPRIQIAIYRIAQEALNNIVKHSQATAVSIELNYDEQQVNLFISDNGSGFNLQNVRPSALGLQIMHERAEAIDAMLQISSAPTQGTKLFVRWIDK